MYIYSKQSFYDSPTSLAVLRNSLVCYVSVLLLISQTDST